MKRTGVILGFTGTCSVADGARILSILEERYPSVVFTLVDQAAGHLVFEFDDGTTIDASKVHGTR